MIPKIVLDALYAGAGGTSLPSVTQLDFESFDTSSAYALGRFDMLNTTHGCIVYQGSGSDGYGQTFSINGSGIITLIDNTEFYTADLDYPDVSWIDSGKIQVAFEAPVSSLGVTRNYSIDGSYNIGSIDKTLTHISSNAADYNRIVMLDSTHFVVVFTDTNGDGIAKTFTLDGSYNITESDSDEFDTADATEMGLDTLDSTHFITSHVSTSGVAEIKTFSVDGSYLISLVDTHQIAGDNGGSTNIKAISATNAIGSYVGTDGHGYIQSISLDGSFNITRVQEFKFTFDSITEVDHSILTENRIAVVYKKADASINTQVFRYDVDFSNIRPISRETEIVSSGSYSTTELIDADIYGVILQETSSSNGILYTYQSPV